MKQDLLENINETYTDFGQLGTIHEAIVRNAQATPDKIAILLDDQSLTCEQLLNHSQTLAAYLIQTCHVKKGDIIGQCVERSLQMIIGMLAIMMAGGVYCPLNPSDPGDRLNTLIEDTRACIVLTHTALIKRFNDHVLSSQVSLVNMDDVNMKMSIRSTIDISSDDVAYVVHTSGSTGKPKSIQLTHANFLNALYGYLILDIYCGRSGRILQVASCSFDLHVMECLGPLLLGNTIVMLRPNGNLDLEYVANTIQRHSVTTACFVPSFLYVFYEYLKNTKNFLQLKSMEQIAFGGDAIQPMRMIETYPTFSDMNITLVNLYGPAECSVWTSYQIVTDEHVKNQWIPIGRPLPNYQCYILDEYLQTVPIGSIGELYVGGAGVFAGYLNRPDLTEKALIDLDQGRGRCYKTGDLVKLIRDGEMLFCGRCDFQVKLRGQRIELGEIESTILQSTPHVSNCVVVKHTEDSNQEHLIAYIELSSMYTNECKNNFSKLQESIRRYCKSILPTYMIPSAMIMLDKLPLNNNGKIDRKQLPTPDKSIFSQQEEQLMISPRNIFECTVHDIWCQLLSRKKISVNTGFFSIGGDSLLCMKLLSWYQSNLHLSNVSIKHLFESTTIEEQAKLLKEMKHGAPDENQFYLSGLSDAVASHAQQRLYLDEQIHFADQDSLSIYSIPFAWHITLGYVDKSQFHNALCGLIERHQILRTVYDIDQSEGVIKQLVYPFHEQQHLEWEETYLDSLSSNEITPLLEQSIYRRFDLNRGPLLRCHIIQSKNNPNKNEIIVDEIMFLNIHHIAFDGASAEILHRELAAMYRGEILDPLPVQYIDYTLQIDALSSTQPSYHHDKDFWLQKMAHSIDHRVQLPYDRPHPSQRIGTARKIRLHITKDLLSALEKHREENRLTVFMQMLALYQIFLARLTGQTDICVGSVYVNRLQKEIQDLLGFFVNTLPYRCQISHHETFDSICKKMKALCSEVLEHASLPFDEIVKLHRAKGEPMNQIGFTPFFQTVLTYENVERTEASLDFHSAKTTPYEFDVNTTMFDLELVVQHQASTQEEEETLSISFIYATDVFEQQTVQLMMNRFFRMITDVFEARKQQEPIRNLSLLLDVDRDRIERMNETYTDFGQLGTIHGSVVQHALATPDNLAMLLDDQSLTYEQLLNQSQTLAAYLIQTCHVKKGDIIGQCVERSLQMSIGMLAIMMAGGVYCPLNPSDPEDRLNTFIEDTRARIVLTHTATISRFTDHVLPFHVSLVNMDDVTINMSMRSTIDISSDDVAYVVHTSGSTGKPKSIQLTHRNFLNTTYGNLMPDIHCGINGRILQMASCSFDQHVMECLGPLVLGNTIVMLRPNGNLDLEYVANTIQRHNVTTASFVPSFLYVLYDYLRNTNNFLQLKSMKQIAFGGEAIQSMRMREIFRTFTEMNIKLVNWYGPAECTVDTLYHIVTEEDIKDKCIPIGRPLPNYQCYILDENLQAVPIGSMGELYIGGSSVFVGYLNRPDLTEKALIDLDQGRGRCYKTGDLVKLNKDGEILFCGRCDFQVKLRGQRIELEEIETVILDASSDINNCIVIKIDDHERNAEYLVAYLELAQTLLSEINNDKEKKQAKYNELEACAKYHCLNHLAPYMLPSAWLVMDSFPLNSSGKIDRKKLPKISRLTPIDSQSDSNVSIAPLESCLREIFSEAFHVHASRIAPHTSFGEMGGTSLGAMVAVKLIRERLYPSMAIGVLFSNPSIRSLGNVIGPLIESPSGDESLDQNSIADSRCELIAETSRPIPSLFIETLGIFLLVYHYLFPIWASIQIVNVVSKNYESLSPNFLRCWIETFISVLLFVILFAVIQLFHYVVLKWLLFGRIRPHRCELYSWRYYRFWFVSRIWNLNSPLLLVISGTPMYNLYLRICGARIGRNVHIYTSKVDALDLLEIGDYTFIASDVTVASLSYEDTTYTCDSVKIGAKCSIQAHCVIQHGLVMQDNVLVKSMSSITGTIPSNSIVDGKQLYINGNILEKDTIHHLQFSYLQCFYQCACILTVEIVGILGPVTTYSIYHQLFPSAAILYYYILLPMLWISWTIIFMFFALFFLCIVIGKVKPGNYAVNSWYYIHKVWFRQLISATFIPSFHILGEYHRLYPMILRCLGNQIGDDVVISDIETFFSGSSNLMVIGDGLTTNGECMFAPIEIVGGRCLIDYIIVDDNVTFGNYILVHCGARIPSSSTIGTMTRFPRYKHFRADKVILGVPASEMPFSLPPPNSKSVDSSMIRSLTLSHIWEMTKDCFIQPLLVELGSKLLLSLSATSFLVLGLINIVTRFTSLTNMLLLSAPFYLLFMIIYSIGFCLCYRACYADIWQPNVYPYEKIISWRRHIVVCMLMDFESTISKFLDGTQWLVYLYRGMGAKIGRDVILSNFHNLTEPQLITIHDHVRISYEASIQCHTYEQRLYQLVPTSIGAGSILDNRAMIFPGCNLDGNNQIYPCTLILKGDRLAHGTTWHGSPPTMVKTPTDIYTTIQTNSSLSNSLLTNANFVVDIPSEATRLVNKNHSKQA